MGSRHFHGIDASGAGTRVHLQSTHVSDNGKYGVVATHRAVVQLQDCKSVSNTQAGVSAQERGEVLFFSLLFKNFEVLATFCRKLSDFFDAVSVT